MSHTLVLATRNQGKITEFRRILEELAPGQIELIGVDQFPHLVDVDENTGQITPNNVLDCIKKHKLKKIKSPLCRNRGKVEILYQV